MRESALKMVERIVEEEKSSDADSGMTVVAFASCHRTFVTSLCKNIDIQSINKIFNTSVGAMKRLSGLMDRSGECKFVQFGEAASLSDVSFLRVRQVLPPTLFEHFPKL